MFSITFRKMQVKCTVPSHRFIHIYLLLWHSYPTWSKKGNEKRWRSKNQMRQPKIHIRKIQKSKISESYRKKTTTKTTSKIQWQNAHCTLEIHVHLSSLTTHIASRIAYRSHFTQVNFFSIEYGHVHIECIFSSVIVNRDSRLGLWERVKCLWRGEDEKNKIKEQNKYKKRDENKE